MTIVEFLTRDSVVGLLGTLTGCVLVILYVNWKFPS